MTSTLLEAEAKRIASLGDFASCYPEVKVILTQKEEYAAENRALRMTIDNSKKEHQKVQETVVLLKSELEESRGSERKLSRKNEKLTEENTKLKQRVEELEASNKHYVEVATDAIGMLDEGKEKEKLLQRLLYDSKTEQFGVGKNKELAGKNPGKTKDPFAEKPETTKRRGEKLSGKSAVKTSQMPFEIGNTVAVDTEALEKELAKEPKGTIVQFLGCDFANRIEMNPMQPYVRRYARLKLKFVRPDKTYRIWETPLQESRKGVLYGDSFAAAVAYIKYKLGVPLSAQQKLFQSFDCDIKRGSLEEMLSRSAANWLLPVVNKLEQLLMSRDTIQNDGTPILILHVNGEENPKQKYILISTSSELETDKPEILMFRLMMHRSKEELRRLLIEQGFKGDALSDAYSAYLDLENATDGEITVCFCLAHARRKIFCAYVIRKGDSDESGLEDTPEMKVLGMLHEIYKSEGKGRDVSPEERLKIRQTEIKPKMEELYTYLESLNLEDPHMSSTMREAVGYFLHNKKQLCQFLDKPNVPIDNNFCERTVKAVIGVRNSSHFCINETGAENLCIYCTLISTAEANGVNGMIYLQYLLENMPKHHTPGIEDEDMSYLDDMLPWSDAFLKYKEAWAQARSFNDPQLRRQQLIDQASDFLDGYASTINKLTGQDLEKMKDQILSQYINALDKEQKKIDQAQASINAASGKGAARGESSSSTGQNADSSSSGSAAVSQAESTAVPTAEKGAQSCDSSVPKTADSIIPPVSEASDPDASLPIDSASQAGSGGAEETRGSLRSSVGEGSALIPKNSGSIDVPEMESGSTARSSGSDGDIGLNPGFSDASGVVSPSQASESDDTACAAGFSESSAPAESAAGTVIEEEIPSCDSSASETADSVIPPVSEASDPDASLPIDSVSQAADSGAEETRGSLRSSVGEGSALIPKNSGSIDVPEMETGSTARSSDSDNSTGVNPGFSAASGTVMPSLGSVLAGTTGVSGFPPVTGAGSPSADLFPRENPFLESPCIGSVFNAGFAPSAGTVLESGSPVIAENGGALVPSADSSQAPDSDSVSSEGSSASDSTLTSEAGSESENVFAEGIGDTARPPTDETSAPRPGPALEADSPGTTAASRKRIRPPGSGSLKVPVRFCGQEVSLECSKRAESVPNSKKTGSQGARNAGRKPPDEDKSRQFDIENSPDWNEKRTA